MSHPITSLIHSRSPPEDQLCPIDIYSSVPQTNNYNTFSGIRAPVTFGTAYTPRSRYQLIQKKIMYHKLTEVINILIMLALKHSKRSKPQILQSKVQFRYAHLKNTASSLQKAEYMQCLVSEWSKA